MRLNDMTLKALTMAASFVIVVSCTSSQNKQCAIASSEQPIKSSSVDTNAQVKLIGKEYNEGIQIMYAYHLIFITTDCRPDGGLSIRQTKDALHKILGDDYTNYMVMEEIF
jgi:hypothetical protein